MDSQTYLKKIQELIGPTGLSVLNQALAKSSTSIETLEAIDVLPRAFLSWFYQKLNHNNYVAGKMPGSDLIADIRKSEQGYSGYFVLNKLDKKEFINSTELEIASAILETVFDLKLQKNLNLESIQTNINKMVEQFHFKEKSISVILKNDYSVCSDCGEIIKLKELNSKVCLCYKALGSKHIHVMKNENNTLKVSFDSNWDKASIKLFVSAIENIKK